MSSESFPTISASPALVIDPPAPNGSTTHIPALNGDHVNGLTNGANGHHLPEPVLSPIIADIQAPESDVRHDFTALKDASVSHSPPEDVQMVEAAPVNGNGNSNHEHILPDVAMSQSDLEIPPLTASSSRDMEVDSHDSRDNDHDGPPPAKRARVHSDADQASSTAPSASPPPPSTNGTPVPQSTTPVPKIENSAASPRLPALMSGAQYRFCQATLRSLKKNKDAAPFLKPVDTVALNIPHYTTIVTQPMDFSTVERKLSSSNPSKPDPNPNNPRYLAAEAFVSDVNLIFANCYAFNGMDHNISQMAKRVEDTFAKQHKQMPPPDAPKPAPRPPVVKKQATSPVPPKKSQVPRRPSVPQIRRSDNDPPTRPKREVHPPAPRDLLYTEPKKTQRKPKRVASKDDGTLEQLKFCSKLLGDLHRKQYWTAANPFYEPVDPIKLGIPEYFKFVKKPMDLATMRKKMEHQEYQTARKFQDDFKLLVHNCYIFNPPGTPVHMAGQELERIFNEKWLGLPPLHDGLSDDLEDDEDEDDDDLDDSTRAQREIQRMEMKLQKMKQLAGSSKPKKKKEKAPRPLQASSSKASAAKPPKTASSSAPGKKKKQKPTDDDVLSFEQKKDLSEAITNLDESKLERVIQIIHDGVPEIRNSTEEIELEIDLLPAGVLTKLYNFVVRPLRTPASKRSRGGKGTGTGGLKRKSMDEDVEAEKIRQLEQRIALFEGGPNAGLAAIAEAQGGSDRSSDSSDDSDSSASDDSE